MVEPQIVEFEARWQQQACELIARCLKEFGYDFEPEGLDQDVAEISAHYGGEKSRFWVMLQGDAVVGTVGIRQLDGNTCELKRMDLARELRGQGHGRRLLQTAVKFAREVGYRRIVLNTAEGMSAARWLYSRFGFKEIAPYNDNPRAACYMALDLDA